jgi:pimeloyl-ACP methyl ester carboxylesterase
MITDSVASARPDKSTTVRARKGPPFSLRAMRRGMSVLSRVAPEGAAALAERIFLTPRRRVRPATEVAVLAKARRRTLPTENGELAAWEWGGESESAPRVLLVHGWEGRGAQLGALVEPLTALGFRVVTFDAAGHGDSPGDRSSLFHVAHAVERAAEVFGPFHAIVTHSMGGPSTIWASRRASLASRLVMIAPPVDLRDFTRNLSRILGLPEDVRGRVHRRLGARFGVPIEEVRAEALASAMREPLLVLHDEDDREVPIACGELIARAWPGAELVRTHGLGHQRILRDAEVVRTVVRFVAQGQQPRRVVAEGGI